MRALVGLELLLEELSLMIKMSYGMRWTARLILLLVLVAPAAANFAIFQVANNTSTPPDGVCNINTGIYSGVGGAGTCNSTLATCNGSADDTPAFASFNTWATGTWQVAHPGLKIGFDFTGNCLFVSTVAGGNSFATNIKRLRVNGTGPGSASLKDGGAGFTLAGQGMFQDNLHSARIATVSKGATSLALTACPGAGCAAAVALFTVGDVSIITGVDMQGPGSSPPNPAFWDWITINCVSPTLTCNGGNIGFNESLTYQYKSTWPLYDAGGAFAYDQGGPGTIYAIHQNWNTDVEYQNLTIDAPAQQTQSIGRSTIFTNVAFTGAICMSPTETRLMRFVGSTMTNCNMEVDKMIDGLEFYGTVIHNISVQSASVKNFVFSGSTANSINGLFLNNTFSNGSNIAILSTAVGSWGGFGVAGAVTVSNSNIASLLVSGNISTAQRDVNLQFTMTSGVIAVPGVQHVTGATNNGSGLIRLTVGSTTAYTVAGQEVIFSISSGCVGSNGGVWLIDVIDGTHLDLRGSTAFSTTPAANSSLAWSAGTVTVQTASPHGLTSASAVVIAGVTPSAYNGTYIITVTDTTHFTYALTNDPGTETVPGTWLQTCTGNFGSVPANWAIPGANFFLYGGNLWGLAAQVTDLTQDANFTYIHTTFAGGWPVVPLSLSLTGVAASSISIAASPAPKWTSSGATGDPEVVDLNNAGAQGLPLGSYSKRVITSANGNPASPITIPMWGTMTGVNLTVGTAYTGATGTMHFDFGGPGIQTIGSATETVWSFEVNAKIASATPRAISPTAATGAQSGDTLTPPGANTWLLFNQMAPQYSSIPGDFGSTSTTVEIITNQGVVYPFLLKRDLDPVANDNSPMWLNQVG